MSILIKGMDMPKKGERYNIILLDDGSVTTFKLVNNMVYESFKNNPLEKHEAVEIHTTQGRLVEGRLVEEFEKNLYRLIDPYEIPGAMQALYDALDDAQQY